MQLSAVKLSVLLFGLFLITLAWDWAILDIIFLSGNSIFDFDYL